MAGNPSTDRGGKQKLSGKVEKRGEKGGQLFPIEAARNGPKCVYSKRTFSGNGPRPPKANA